MAGSLKPRQPAVFVPHGGGPMPILGDPSHGAMVAWLKGFQRNFVTTKPDAIVLVTAHWEEDVTTITSAAAPELLYDYYGFPDAAYEIKYPAPGSPALASKIHDLLAARGIASKLDAKRGNDHGVFIPLKLMFPKADVPVVQMSIMNSLDPEAHIQLGEALHELRKENVLLVGSGLSFHSFKYFFGSQDHGHRLSLDFHEYLTESLVATKEANVRRERLTRWRTQAPHAREVHPREEHLVPLFVIAGAGLDEPCEEIFADKVIGVHTVGYLFGERS
jgi:4,5-DOPA dioxygenase extradiol